MRLIELYLKAFAKFKDYKITFKPGLNIVYGENESGKTTLHKFMEGVFFSFKKADSPRRYFLDEQKRFKPWQGDNYSGTIVYEHDSHLYRLEREFSKTKDELKLYLKKTGEELTANFKQKPNQEREILEKQLGLNPNIFKNTISIGQLGHKCGEELIEELKSSLANLMETGKEEISLVDTSKALETAIDEIGTERQKTKPYYQLIEKINGLKEELRLTEKLFLFLREQERDLKDLSEEQKELELKKKKAEDKLKEMKKAKLFSLYLKIKKGENKVAEIKEQLIKVSHLKDFPCKTRDSLLNLLQRLKDLEERLKDLREEINEKNLKAEQYEDFLRKYTSLKDLSTNDLNNFKLIVTGLKEKKENLKNNIKKLGEFREEYKRTKDFIDDNYPQYEGLSQEDLEESKEKKAKLSNNKGEILKYDLKNIQEKINVFNKKLKSKKKLTISGTILFILAIINSFFFIEATLVFIPSIILLIMGLLNKPIKSKLTLLEAEKIELVKQLQEKEKEQGAIKNKLNQIYEQYSVDSLKELSLKYSEYKDEVWDLSLQEKSIKDLAADIETEKKNLEIKEKELEEYLKLLNTEKIKKQEEQITYFTKILEKYLKKKEKKEELAEEIKSLKKKEEKLVLSKDNLQNEVKELLAKAKVKDFVNYEKKYKKYQEYKELEQKLSNQETELKAIIGDKNLSSIYKQVKEIVNPAELPVYQEEIERNLNEEVEDLSLKINEIDKNIGVLETEIKTRLEQNRNLAEIEEDLNLANKEKEEKEINRNALLRAKSLIEKLSKNIHREFAPTLNQEISSMIVEITENKYTEVKISPNLEIRVITPQGLTKDISELSHGTIDLFYFSTRIAIANFLTANDKLPLFLDETFVQFDQKRLKKVLIYLNAVAKKRQIILFTCHQREKRIIKHLGLDANIINL